MDKLIIINVICMLLIFSFISLVQAQDINNPTAGLENATGGILDQGGIHTEKINQTAQGYKSQAELRIEAINNWLESNAAWFKVVFGMIPEISWLFAIVMLVWLFLLLILVLNGSLFGIVMSNKNYARLAGAVLFIVLIASKAAYCTGAGIYNLLKATWNSLLSYGITIAIIAIGLIVLFLIALVILAPQVLTAIKKWRDERRKKEKESEQETNQEALSKLVEGAIGQKS